MPKYCGMCGALVDDSVKWCTKCGARIWHDSNTANQFSQSDQTGKAIGSGAKKGLSKPAIAVLCTLLTAAVLVGGYFIFQHFNGAKSTASDNNSVGLDGITAANSDDAIAEYEAYILKHPNSADGYLWLSSVYCQLEKYEDAVATLEDGLTNVPGDSELITALMQASYDGGMICPDGFSGTTKQYSDAIYSINSSDQPSNTVGIDPYEINYSPAPRNTELIWDKSIYRYVKRMDYSLPASEAISYTVTRKQLQNLSTGNLMEYEIYTTSSGKVNRIVSIEYIGNHIEIIDYYYENDGKVNFIFKRTDTVYTPEFAMLNMPGERFFFNDDVMVKWRIITSNGRTDIPIGEAERIRANADEYTVMYAELSPSYQSEYDSIEIKMLNAAYNTRDIVLGAQGICSISGNICDIDGEPVGNAIISLYSYGCDAWVYECVSGADGSYSIAVPSASDEFRLKIRCNGCSSVDVYNISITEQIISTYIDTVYVIPFSQAEVSVRLLAIDAFTATSVTYSDDYAPGLIRLDGATLTLRRGIGNRTGAVFCTGSSDSSGWYDVTLPPGCYTVEISKAGYTTSYITIIVRFASEVVQLSTTPSLQGGELRIVLTWGQTPSDLDSHLFTPYIENSDVTGYHIWYGNMSDADHNNLDVDDTTGYGPETMTIRNFGSGLYKYYVADYTNCSFGNPTSDQMSRSGATVSVFSNEGLIATFHVPTNRPGVIWEVFELRDMQIIPIQRYYDNIADKPWWNQDKW